VIIDKSGGIRNKPPLHVQFALDRFNPEFSPAEAPPHSGSKNQAPTQNLLVPRLSL
jgi:hypothetical protein